MTARLRLVAVVAGAVALRPRLWLAAVASMLRLAAPGWWRRAPFLPMPAPDLWAFRMETAYGDPRAVPSAADVVAFIRWSDQDVWRRRPGP